ncbi:MAG: biopolymer transporter ExbD [Planctomycetota bacterium]
MNATRTIGITLVAATLAALAGCANEGGLAMSLDRFVYKSTEFQPKTVIVRDVRDQSELWSLDIPVGSRVTIWFNDNVYDDPILPARMRWDLYPRLSDRDRQESYEVRVPGEGSRRLEMVIRDGPELPADPVEALAVQPTGELPAYVPPRQEPASALDRLTENDEPAPVATFVADIPEVLGPTQRAVRVIGADAVLFAGGQYSIAQLGEALRELHQTEPDLEIIVRANASVPFGSVQRVVDAVKAAGYDVN